MMMGAATNGLGYSMHTKLLLQKERKVRKEGGESLPAWLRGWELVTIDLLGN